MTEEQARAEAARLNRDSPEADRAVWAPRRGDTGEWQVVRVRVPGFGSRRLASTVAARPHKPDPGQLAPPSEPRPWWGPA